MEKNKAAMWASEHRVLQFKTGSSRKLSRKK